MASGDNIQPVAGSFDQRGNAGTADRNEAAWSDQPPVWVPDHVVVFVHGMGAALKGGTLREWAEPLLESLHDIALDHSEARTYQPPLVIDYTSVDSHDEAWVRVRKTSQNSGYLNVLLTEARWAEDFAPATPVATYWWSFLMAFRVWWRSMGLLYWNLRPSWRANPVMALPAIIIWAAIVVVSLPVLIVFLILLLLLVLLAWVPIVRKYVGKIVETFAEFLGDPRVWTRSPLQAAAMRQRVITTLEKSKASGANVTVVAHSQGAAIAGQVLLTGKARATNFVSVGSGLPLLGYARFGGTATGKEADPVHDWVHLAPPLRWVNMWGKFDFVPAGPMGSKEDRRAKLKRLFGRGADLAPGPEEHPVFNRSALVMDHVVYSKNRVEVIDPIAQLIYKNSPAPANIGDESETWLLPAGTQDQVASEHGRRNLHRLMVKCLGVTRLLAVFAGAALALPLLSWLQSLPLIDYLFQCPTGQEATTERWPCSKFTPVVPPITWQDALALTLAAAAIIGLMLAVLNRWLWEWLHQKVERRRTRSGSVSYATPRVLAVYLAAVIAATVAMPIYVAVQVLNMPGATAGAWAFVSSLLVLMSLGKTDMTFLKARRSRI